MVEIQKYFLARGKWFRRQFLQLCTTILQNTFFAGKFNLKMKELIGEFTEDTEVATYIDKMRERNDFYQDEILVSFQS